MTDPDDTIPDNPRPLTTEEQIAELETERKDASFGRRQQIAGELEELYIRLGYEKTGKVTL